MNNSTSIGGILIRLPGSILEKIEIINTWLVLFERSSAHGEDRERNIWAYTDRGEFLWKVQRIPRGPWGEEGNLDWFVKFTGQKFDKVRADTFGEVSYLIDPKTGDLYRTDNVQIPKVKFAAELLELQKKGLYPK